MLDILKPILKNNEEAWMECLNDCLDPEDDFKDELTRNDLTLTNIVSRPAESYDGVSGNYLQIWELKSGDVKIYLRVSGYYSSYEGFEWVNALNPTRVRPAKVEVETWRKAI